MCRGGMSCSSPCQTSTAEGEAAETIESGRTMVNAAPTRRSRKREPGVRAVAPTEINGRTIPESGVVSGQGRRASPTAVLLFFSHVCRAGEGCGQPQTGPGRSATGQSQGQEKMAPDAEMFRSSASRPTVQSSGELVAAGPRCSRGPAAVKTMSSAVSAKGRILSE